ncbi:MAG: histidine ammonia-lyase [Candidatus Aminicenantales bacterium]
MIEIDDHLSLDDFLRVTRDNEPVCLSVWAKERLRKGRAAIEDILKSGEAVYGVNTGFGKFQNTRIAPDKLRELQRNLILSHAIGVGGPLPADVVRGILLLRVQSLARGRSGIRASVVERLCEFLNLEIHPVIPSQGSVGSSGDLAPLAHMALALIGEGEVVYEGSVWPTADALASAGLEPLELEAKEGLALINGTQVMGSILALLVADTRILMTTADIAAAMSVEALKGSHAPFDELIMNLRPHRGALETAENLRRLLADSEIRESHAGCAKVQDAYSLRAIPQVHGASRDAFRHVAGVVEVEMDSVTDNPLIFPEEGRVISGGNFHGQPLALAGDYAGIALAELADISERRIEQMLNPALSGLPAFLSEQGGLHSGLMISQYTAASLVSENKVLAHPASVDSIPTSANQEDHVSMGTIACRKARRIFENVIWVLTIELVSAAQALDFHKPLRPGKGVAAAHAVIRSSMPHLARDRYLKPEIDKIRTMIRNGEIVRAVQAAVGPLH